MYISHNKFMIKAQKIVINVKKLYLIKTLLLSLTYNRATMIPKHSATILLCFLNLKPDYHTS